MKKGCPEEYPIILLFNGYEIATFQLTKQDLEDWTYGYLFSEGIISSPKEIESVNVEMDQGTIRVVSSRNLEEDNFFEKKKHYTAGCGRGVTFFSMTDVKQFAKVKTNKQATLSYLLKKRHEFAVASPLYLETGGMHGACIIDKDGNIHVREDIGRHNAVDKVIGHAIRNEWKPEELILLTTGRISYEMLSKAAKFGFGIVGSRTAATKQALQLASFLQVEVVGYMRGKMATVYTPFNRVIDDLNRSVE